MQKNKCQAYTKKKKPCKNYAMKGSHFCFVHKESFKDFPPVKITALICPYCDTPVKKDAKFCSFCKEDLTPAIPKPDKLNYYYGKLVDIRNRIAAKAKGIDIGYGCFMIIMFFLFTFVFFFIVIGMYFHLHN